MQNSIINKLKQPKRKLTRMTFFKTRNEKRGKRSMETLGTLELPRVTTTSTQSKRNSVHIKSLSTIDFDHERATMDTERSSQSASTNDQQECFFLTNVEQEQNLGGTYFTKEYQNELRARTHQRHIAEMNKQLELQRAEEAKRLIKIDTKITKKVTRISKQAGETLDRAKKTEDECLAILSEYKTWCKDYKKLCAISLEKSRKIEERSNPKRYALFKKEWESLREHLPKPAESERVRVRTLKKPRVPTFI